MVDEIRSRTHNYALSTLGIGKSQRNPAIYIPSVTVPQKPLDYHEPMRENFGYEITFLDGLSRSTEKVAVASDGSHCIQVARRNIAFQS